MSIQTLLMAKHKDVQRLAKWLGLKETKPPKDMTPHQYLCRRVATWTRQPTHQGGDSWK
jgi:hypothetical protein